MSPEDVSAATAIPLEDFVEKSGVTEAEIGEPMKEHIETEGSNVRDDIRGWVQEQLEAAAAE